MYEYSWMVQRVRDYQYAGEVREDAITKALQDCIDEDIMADFIREHGSEVYNMLFTQFNMEDAEKVWKEEAYKAGRSEGLAAVSYTHLRAHET